MKQLPHIQRIILALGMLALCCSTDAAIARTHTAVPTPSKPRLMTLSTFNRIEAAGQVVVTVTGSGPQRVMVTKFQAQNKPVTQMVRNQTLIINAPAGSRAAYTIQMRTLRGISVSGNAKIVSRNINPLPMVISAGGNSTISLDGNPVQVSQINASGRAKVNIRWLRSDDLGIQASGNSKLNLAGVAKRIHARLTGNAELQAQSLRSQTIWAQTQGQANMRLLPIQRLDAFASNSSNIYYYKRPKQLNTYTKQSGNVLQWRHWS